MTDYSTALAEYSKTTNSVTVRVTPQFLERESVPGEEHFVWLYHIRLENRNEHPVQLLNRYWRITDCRGQVQEVRGPGVIGQQPVLRPGQMFEYVSGAQLDVPSGVMSGVYEMVTEEGARFDVVIPTFSLDSPQQISRPN